MLRRAAYSVVGVMWTISGSRKRRLAAIWRGIGPSVVRLSRFSNSSRRPRYPIAAGRRTIGPQLP